MPDLHFTSARRNGRRTRAVDRRGCCAVDGGRTAATGAPAAPGAARDCRSHVGWISGGRAELRLRALGGPAGRRLRRRDVLRDVLDDAAAARVSCTSATTSRASAPAPRSFAPRSTRVGPPGLTSADGGTWLRSPCLGCAIARPRRCSRAADAVGRRSRAGERGAASIAALASRRRTIDGAPHIGGSPLRLLRRVGLVDPESLDDYRAHGGYARLRARSRSGRERRHRRSHGVETARPRRRGVSDRPQMEAVARAPARPHYLVCNADESEPGTFKDRVLMENDPFADRRSDDDLPRSPPAASAASSTFAASIRWRRGGCDHAIAQARTAGLLGDDVMGSGVRFDIEIRRGAGAYICGEETALSTRSKASAASRAASRRFRSSPDCSASRRSSTTSKRWPIFRTSCSTAAPRTRASARRIRRARGSSACRGRSRGPGSTKCRTARRCAR